MTPPLDPVERFEERLAHRRLAAEEDGAPTITLYCPLTGRPYHHEFRDPGTGRWCVWMYPLDRPAMTSLSSSGPGGRGKALRGEET